jgi:ferredoxin
MHELPTFTLNPRLARGPDLLRWSGLRRLLRWRYARLILQLPIALLALLVLIDGFTGVQLAPRNLATTSVWLHYRGLVVLALLTVGNLFCASCPLMLTRGPARFAKRLLPREWRWPTALRSKLLVWALMLGYFYAYEAFDLWASPWLTAWLVLGYFGSAWVIDTLFPAGTFCRYVCPLGNFNFVLASASPTIVSTIEPSVCLSCEQKPCLHGRISDHATAEARWRTPSGALLHANDGPRKAAFIPRHEITHDNGSGRFPGCETGLFVPAITSNLDCTLCGNCLRACPYDNVTLRLRSVAREGIAAAWRGRGLRSALLLGISLSTWGMLNAFAMVPAYYQVADTLAAALNTRAEWLLLAVIFAVTTTLGLALAFAASHVADRLAGAPAASPWVAVERWGMVWVTLGVGFWAAHYLFHFLTGALAIVPVFEHFFALRGFAIDPQWRFAQLVPSRWLFPIGAGVVSLATLVALWQVGRIALRDFGNRGLAAAWWLGLLVLAVAVLQVLLLGLPMEMRGTLLGPLPGGGG